MNEDRQPSRSPHHRSRVAVGGLCLLISAWLLLSFAISVGTTVLGGSTPNPKSRPQITYVAGADNTKGIKACIAGFKRLFEELKARMSLATDAKLGTRSAKRWHQWMDHFQLRVAAERRRCHLEDESVYEGDPVLDELASVADVLEELTDEYGRVHSKIVIGLRDDVVAIEGFFARATARLNEPQ